MEISEKETNFSVRLKMARRAKGLTQERLAKLIKVSKGTVGNWETSGNGASAENIKAISDILNVSVGWLSGGDGGALPTARGTVETISIVPETHSEMRDQPPQQGPNPLEREARDYLEKFLGTCRGDVRRLGWAVTELEARLPLDKWAAADARPPAETPARYEAGPRGQVRKVDPNFERQSAELLSKALQPDAAPAKKGKA